MNLVNSYRFVSGGGGFDPDAQAFIDAVGTLTGSEETAINNLVIGLKANNTWSKYKAIYPFVGGTASAHKFNLKDPRDLDLAFRIGFGTGWVHDNNGITGNGSNTVADTNFVIVTELTASSIAYSLYSRTNIAQQSVDFGIQGTRRVSCHLTWSEGSVISDMFTNNGPSRVMVSSNGSDAYFNMTRISNTDHRVFKNGVQIGIDTVDDSASFPLIPTTSAYIGWANPNSNNASTRNYAFATIGTGLTSTEVASDYTVVQAYQTALNREV